MKDHHSTETAGGDAAIAARDLNDRLADASPSEIIRTALRIVGRERLALVSSFGTESAVLLHLAAEIDAAIPVLFIDTGHIFEETCAYRQRLIAALGLRDVRDVKPCRQDVVRADPDRELWMTDPDACCQLRKVEPLARALVPFDAWMNGRKRFQGGLRADIPVVEQDGPRLKFNPLAKVSRADLMARHAAAQLPPHPLLAKGFASVGCIPCTSRTSAQEDARAGRWRGRSKTECGIHLSNAP